MERDTTPSDQRLRKKKLHALCALLRLLVTSILPIQTRGKGYITKPVTNIHLLKTSVHAVQPSRPACRTVRACDLSLSSIDRSLARSLASYNQARMPDIYTHSKSWIEAETEGKAKQSKAKHTHAHAPSAWNGEMAKAHAPSAWYGEMAGAHGRRVPASWPACQHRSAIALLLLSTCAVDLPCSVLWPWPL